MAMLLFYLFLALFVSFMCSILEAVLLSVTPSYIGAISNERVKARLFRLKANIDDAISSILILNTIANTMGAAGVGAEAVSLFGIQWHGIVAMTLTLMILFFSEIIPKTIGATYWRNLAAPASLVIRFLMKFLFPLIWISSHITRAIKKDEAHIPSREEIVALAELSGQGGVLEEKEEKLIFNMMHLKEVRVKEILTPRSVVYSLDARATIASALEDDELFHYSRIPVYSESSQNIAGMVFARKILAASLGKGKGMPIETIMEPVFSVSKNLPVYYLLDRFIKREEHLFVVRDEYGQYTGIVTLEDAIETLLGVEIVDEVDEFVDMRQLARERSERWKQRG
jgi:CBS domain containing-hemolysin-like protein